MKKHKHKAQKNQKSTETSITAAAMRKKVYSRALDGKLRYALPVVLMLIAAGFIVYGIFDDEINAVFGKAIELCTQCIGIG